MIFASSELKLAAHVLGQDEYIDFFQGTRNAQTLTIALFSWLAYEHTVTSIDELVFFWKDREWTKGRGLFFINRYTTWLAIIASLYVALVPNPTLQTCTRAIRVSLLLNLFCIAVGQAYVSNIFWNIFEHQRNFRISLAICLGLSIALSLVLFATSDKHLVIVTTIDSPSSLLTSAGCKAYPPKRFWTVYIPPLLFHGYLYSLAIYVTVQGADSWEFSEAVRKVFWDGTTIFSVVLVTSLCTIIFSSKTHMLWLSIPAAFCPIMLTATSVTLTRRSITTRMFIEHKTSALTDSQDPMSNAIELIPLDKRNLQSKNVPGNVLRSVVGFMHLSLGSSVSHQS